MQHTARFDKAIDDMIGSVLTMTGELAAVGTELPPSLRAELPATRKALPVASAKRTRRAGRSTTGRCLADVHRWGVRCGRGADQVCSAISWSPDLYRASIVTEIVIRPEPRCHERAHPGNQVTVFVQTFNGRETNG